MRFSFFWTFIILTIILSIVGFWYYQRNIYSKGKIKLEILAPDKVAAFEEVEYIVKFKNNGNISLEDVSLTFEYPEFSILPEGVQNIQTINLTEDLYPGQETIRTFKARLVGQKGETRTVRAVLNYRPRGLKAKYESETTHTLIISSVPLSLELDAPAKVDSGRTFSFWINYFSKADYPISDIRISMNYPSGFSFLSSSPRGLADNEWVIPILNKAQGGRIEVKGHVQGEIDDVKNFKAVLGIIIKDKLVPLVESERGLVIARESLYISQLVNGVQNYTISPGDRLHYEIFFRNAGEKPLTDLFLAVRLDNNRILDLESIRTDTGNFKPGDNSITWDWQSIPELKFLGPGEEGSVDFWVKVKDDWDILGPGDKDFMVSNTVSLAQARVEFSYKVNTKLVLNQSAYFKDEIFTNTGPMPPEVGAQTTYTIVWQIKSLYNDASGVKVKAILPKQVSLTGKVFPEEASITFDSETRELVWEVGELKARGSISGEVEKSVAFQVALTPTSLDEGKILKLIDKVEVLGEDNWTGSELRQNYPYLDTTLPNDITVSEEDWYVGGKSQNSKNQE